MQKKLLLLIPAIFVLLISNAQKLQTFTETMQYDGKAYLSIKNKKAYKKTDAEAVKTAIDFALVATFEGNFQQLEWYNMSGRDNKIPETLTGTSSRINGISFDREQFDKCATVGDLYRMTGHVTNSSFSHFASISHTDVINYHCFIAQLETGKRALLYITVIKPGELKVEVKVQE